MGGTLAAIEGLAGAGACAAAAPACAIALGAGGLAAWGFYQQSPNQDIIDSTYKTIGDLALAGCGAEAPCQGVLALARLSHHG